MSNREQTRQPTADERDGMDWWNGLNEIERGAWLRHSKGESAADAWACFKTLNASTRLEIRMEAGGGRHYVGDVALHCGDLLSAQIRGRWYDGRYEASWRDRLPRAAFYYIDEFDQELAVRLDETIPVRIREGRRFL